MPRDWKTAHVSPLFKDGKRDEISNYRPISILPVMAKSFERILHDQIHGFFYEQRLLDPSQSGFRSGHSTIPCAAGVLNNIYKSLDGGSLTGAVFLDLRKAFDTVSHSVLCSKLSRYSVGGSSNALLSNYLSDRFRCT